MNKLVGLFVVAGLLFINIVNANSYIEPKKLFDNPTASRYILSENAQYLLGRRLFNGRGYLELVNVEDLSSTKLIHFDFRNQTYIIDYFWIDNHHVYLKGLYNGIAMQYLVKLEFSADEIKFVVDSIPDKYKLLSKRLDNDGRLWVLERIRTHRTLYSLTIDDLTKSNPENAKTFDYPLDDAINYFLNHDGKPAFGLTSENEEIYVWLLDKNNQWKKSYGLLSTRSKFNVVGWIDENKVAVLSNENTDKVVLIEFDLSKNEYGDILFEHAKYDLTVARMNSKGEVVLVGYMDHGMINYEYIDSELSEERQRVQALFANKRIAIQSMEGSTLVVYAYASGDSGSFYLVDINSNKIKHLRYSYDQHKDIKLTPTVVKVVKNREGEELETYFTPAAKFSDLNVLLVMPHGGPVGVRDDNYYDPLIQFLSNRGYSILRVNYSGSTGFGKAHMEKGRGQLGLKIERDIVDSVNALLKERSFKKRCSIGFSYGGYSAFMLAVDQPNDYQCVVAGFGIYDLKLLFNDSNFAAIKEYREAVEYVVGEESEDLKERSPVYLADKLNSPILIVGGKEDPRARIEHSNRLKYMLGQYKKEYEYLYYNDTGHGHDSWNWDIHQAILTDQFIRKSLELPAIKDKKLRAEDYFTLASAYEFDDIVDNNTVKAVALYRDAAALGHANSAFNLAAIVHRGDGVTKNYNMAVEFYRRADELNFPDAGIRLYNIYSDKYEGPYDEKLAIKYLRRGAKLEHQPAIQKLASILCDAEKIDNNLSECIANLSKIDTKDKDSFKIVQSIADSFFSSDNVERIETIKNYFSTSHAIDSGQLTIKKNSHGIYRWGQYSKYDIEKPVEVPAEVQYGYYLKFGLRSPVEEDASKLVPVKVRWSYIEDEAEKPLFSSYKVYEVGADYRLSYLLLKEEETVSGKYALEILNLEDELLLRQVFYID
ncbi:prolyl oligopeptidase family serine peptidase [Pleionea litopenaei]|uniref:Prolyl oligopeptidase family serine peptidase n=1 Tax=Pleionea litopenaei TaxID=3070815 RepID=A0AA51RSM8_9GAMM|nr:prolyl oligopeptidase family serine peptidase [Pleionea sp. HL-JVS1]WMS86850.1 prolyl oligopeptidase family serine peptidase [Pleionea sp. HL-JVS1]